MTTYRDSLVELAAATEAQLLAAYESWRDGLLTDAEFVAVVAAFVAAGNSRATALADLSLAATLSVALGTVVAPLGLLPAAGTVDRLTRAATTLLDVLPGTPDPPARVARLGRAEPLQAAGSAYSEGMAASPHVVGYRRNLTGTACELCTWLRKGGYVYPADKPMYQHPGCTCTPEPVAR